MSEARCWQGWFPLRAARERISSRPPPVACGWPSSPCLFMSSSLCVCLCVQISPFYEDTSPIGLGLTLVTSLYLDYLCKNPLSI